jgi:hypothetical protein
VDCFISSRITTTFTQSLRLLLMVSCSQKHTRSKDSKMNTSLTIGSRVLEGFLGYYFGGVYILKLSVTRVTGG